MKEIVPRSRAGTSDGFDRSRAGILLRRPLELPRAFGLTTKKYERLLARYRQLLEERGVRATFPVTAVTLRRHVEPLRSLINGGHELAVHGLTHVDLSSHDLGRQREAMVRAREIFLDLGLPAEGFRCPYLWWNRETSVAARQAGFSYVSNRAYLWRDFDRRGVRRLYHVEGRPPSRSLPFSQNGVVEIPVSLPDDFLLARRLKLDSEEIGAVWCRMLADLVAREEMLVLELHPELLPQCGSGLAALLDRARSEGGIWIATLAEIARWWRLRRDFDASGVVQRGRVELTLRTPAGGAVEVRNLPGSKRRGGRRLEIPGDVLPFVAVPRAATSADLLPLRERGFVCHRSENGDHYAARLTVEQLRTLSVEECVAGIEATALPLLKLSNWPGGRVAALSVTGDIDCLTVWDYAWRLVRR